MKTNRNDQLLMFCWSGWLTGPGPPLTGGMSFDKLIKIQLIHLSLWLTDWLTVWFMLSVDTVITLSTAHSVGMRRSWCEDVNKQSQHEEQRTSPAQECSSGELPVPPSAVQWEREGEVGGPEVGAGCGHCPHSLQSHHIQPVVDSQCAASPVR